MSLINSQNILSIISKAKLDSYSHEIMSELESIIQEQLSDKLRKIKNKQRILNNDSKKVSYNISDTLTDSQISTLPQWVKDDLDNARIVGKSKKVIQVSNGKKYHISNNLNDLSGGEWTYFLNSIINTQYSSGGKYGHAHNIRKIHPSPKPPELTKHIINFFSKENELIFDFFMGVGGTLLGASLCNRRAIGIDLSQEYIDTYKKANAELNLNEQLTICGDSQKILLNNTELTNIFKKEQAKLILIDPPYGNMLSKVRTGENNKKKGQSTPFTNLKEDLGNMDINDFFPVLKKMVGNAMKYLQDNGHVVIFIKDMQPNDISNNLLHADLISTISSIKGLKYLGLKIWADHNVNLYPYGYPYSYVANQIHQYILIFKKAQ